MDQIRLLLSDAAWGRIAAVLSEVNDSTVVRAHPHAAGAPQKQGGQAAQALSLSRGGFGTKIHLAAADERTAVAVELTAGQAGDAPVFPRLLDAVPVEYGVADTAYDSDAIRQTLRDRGSAAVIPSNPSRKEPLELDADIYRQRNRVGRLIGKLKQFRRSATRYEKLSETFLALIHLGAAFVRFR